MTLMLVWNHSNLMAHVQPLDEREFEDLKTRLRSLETARRYRKRTKVRTSTGIACPPSWGLRLTVYCAIGETSTAAERAASAEEGSRATRDHLRSGHQALWGCERPGATPGDPEPQECRHRAACVGKFQEVSVRLYDLCLTDLLCLCVCAAAGHGVSTFCE